MGSTLAQLRAAARQELRDEDAAAYVWTDAVIDRHLQDALARLQARAPAVGRLDFVVPTGEPRRWSPLYPATYLWTEAVEYPPDEYPPRFVPFREEGLQSAPSICPLGDHAIRSGATVRLWYAHAYTLAEGSGDQPLQLEPAIVAGAVLFACRDQAIDLGPRLVSHEAVRAYREMADRLRKEWDEALRRVGARSAPMWRVRWD